MGSFIDLVLTLLIVAAFVLGYASIIKMLAFRSATRDGDSFGSRLMGHGPDDEVYYETWNRRGRDDDDDLPKAS